MRRLLIGTAFVVTLAVAASAQQAGALQTAAATLGVDSVRTLAFSGSGRNFSLGQNFTPAEAWPAVTVKSYEAAINYDTASMRQQLLREMGETMPRGGGAPFFGEQRQIQVVSGDFAWNMPAPAPPPAAEPGRVSLADALATVGARPPAPQAQAAAAAHAERMLGIWATPQGFVKAALANNATTRRAGRNTEVTFTVGGKYRMVGLINPAGQVENVRTWIAQSIVGDMLVETTYSDYKGFDGVMFPARIIQSQDGFPTLELTVDTVTANTPIDIPVPDNVRNAAPPAAPTVTSQEMAAGVYFLTGGTHHSLAVAMRDHIVVVDLPNDQARAAAVLAKAKELIPNKPVRFVVTSHHHWDHLGGIREAYAEGATIVTHQTNKQFLERVGKAPHTLAPDRQATVKGRTRIQTIGATGRLTDGTRTIELYTMTAFDHTADLIMVYLPEAKLLALPDAFTPPAQAGQALVITAVPRAQSLAENLARLKLDVDVIVPFHGNRTTTVAEVTAAAGTPAATN